MAIPDAPHSALEPVAAPRHGKRLLIAAAIVLPLSIFPWTCDVTLMDRHWHLLHSGPILCGAVAALLAVIALVRGGLGRGGPGRGVDARGRATIAIGVLALGALAYGLVTVVVVSDHAPPPVEPAVERVLGQLAPATIDALVAAGEPELGTDLAPARRASRAIQTRFGGYRSAGAIATAIGDGGMVQAKGTATYEHGAVEYALVFRPRDGALHLAGFKLHVPVDEQPTDAAGAADAARALTADLAAGAADRVAAEIDPAADPAAIAGPMQTLHQLAGDHAAIEMVAQSSCGGDQQCFDLRIATSQGAVPVHIVEQPTWGLWLATTLRFGDRSK